MPTGAPRRCLSYSFSPTTFLLVLTLPLIDTAGRTSPAQARSDRTAVNKCGCYEESPGVCKCLRKSRCGCPGECEPLGCEEKRQKDLSRRMEEELRKIREEHRDGHKDSPDREDSDPTKDRDGNQDGKRESQQR